jgi:4-diphosphocytidyl-2-C-methyl-D-erythritol kinase
MLTYHSPAKINLSLDILGVRPDGFHELQSVVHCIGLYDVLTFQFGVEPNFSLTSNVPELATTDNLCLKAARAWLEYVEKNSIAIAGQSWWRPAHIRLHKNIPAGAGLGGGSANAATTLRALDFLYRSNLSEKALAQIAARLGADVPLFLRGGCALMEGIGEKLTPLPPLRGAVVVIVPNQHASTPAVYKRYDELGAASQQSTPELLRVMKNGELISSSQKLGNDLRAAAESMGIDVELPIHLLQKHGARAAQMSGSGASSFGLFDSQIAAESAALKIREDTDFPRAYKVLAAPLIAGGIARVES